MNLLAVGYSTFVFKHDVEDEQDLIWLLGADGDSPENYWQDVQPKSGESFEP